jgi:hypothetical protein
MVHEPSHVKQLSPNRVKINIFVLSFYLSSGSLEEEDPPSLDTLLRTKRMENEQLEVS